MDDADTDPGCGEFDRVRHEGAGLMPDISPGPGVAVLPGDGPIAIVSHTHPSVTKGGAEIAAYSLYLGLRQLGVDAIFIAACPFADRNRLLLGSDREFVVMTDPLRYDHYYQLASGDVWRQLKAILTAQNVRLVNFHHYLNFGVNSLRGLAAETSIPFALTLHEFLAICNHHGQMVTRPARRLCPQATDIACATCYPEHARQQFHLRANLIRGAMLPAAGYIAPSHFLADRMIHWGLPREKFVVIENGLRALQPPAPRVRPDGSLWNFGYFGQITPFKGGDTLLDTIDLLAKQPGIENKIRIRVHGNFVGQNEAFVTRFNKTFDGNSFTQYAGAYDNADVHKLMSACDYVLVPSTWWENSPVVIQEAYAAGRPVICTGIGGMAEKVPNRRSGLHFRLNDGADLARVMGEAADDVLYAALCSGIPPVADHLTMARDYLATFAQLLAQRPEDAAADAPRSSPRRRARQAARV
jgi:glycosyltransferase involved in cell wall biosynthesis